MAAVARYCGRGALVGCAILLAAIMLGGAAAYAKGVASFTGSATINDGLGGDFAGGEDVAVDNATGTVYVADSLGTSGATNNPHRVGLLDANGAFVEVWGWDVVAEDGGAAFERCTEVADCKKGVPGDQRGQFDVPTGIAVDQSDGAVYVLDRDNYRVQKFAADGSFLLTFGGGVNETSGGDVCPRPGFPSDACGAGVPGSGAGQIGSVGSTVSPRLAVAAAAPHHVFVTDPGNRRVLEYAPNGDFLRGWGYGVDTGAAAFEICTEASGCQAGLGGAGSENGRFGSAQPQHIALDGAGVVYASDSNGGGRLMRFDATVAGDDEGPGSAAELLLADPLLTSGDGGPLAAGTTEGLDGSALNQTVYVTRAPASGEAVVQEIDGASGTENPGSPHAVGDALTGTLLSIAANEAIGTLYVSYRGTSSHFAACVDVLAVSPCSGLFALDDVGPVAPDAVGQPPANVGAHSATLQASIDPNGGRVFYRFEYSKDGVEWTAVDGAGGVFVGGDGQRTVSVPVDGLEANTLYRSRVTFSKIFTPTLSFSQTSPEAIFQTDVVPPAADTRPPRHVGDVSALLVGRVNANNLPTTYSFEYGRTTSYGSQIPIPAADAGADGVERAVSQLVGGLRPATTYHYRIVATNAQGTTFGPDREFATRSAVPAPPGTAYEMVTPADKNNRLTGYQRDVQGVPIPNTGLPSADGDSMLFTIDHGILDPDAGTAFPHERDAVVIRRGEGGWTGEAIANLPAIVGAVGARLAFGGVSGDVLTSSWAHVAPMFPEGSPLGTRIVGDGGGYENAGWYDWTAGDSAFISSLPGLFQGDEAVLDDDGDTLVRWDKSGSPYRGLLGPDDPSNQQIAGTATYIQQPAGTGERALLAECTGSGADATEVPSRDSNGTSLFDGFPNLAALGDDLIGAQPCEAGFPTHRRGATVGGVKGGGPTATALSDDGRRTFFVSPDPSTQGSPLMGLVAQGNGRNGCIAISTTSAPATENVGPETECAAQLYVRQLDPGGNPVVRWISRPQLGGQSIDLLGRTVFEGASDDGRIVYFRTNTPLVEDDPNGTGAPVPGGVVAGSASDDSWDLYRYVLPADPADDPDEGSLTRVSGGPLGTADPNTNPGGDNGAAARYVSDDGSRAFFVTGAAIPGADDSTPDGGVTTPDGTPSSSDARNLYLYENGSQGTRWKFVARIPYSNADGDVAACASYNATSGPTRTLQTGGGLHRDPSNCVRGTASGDVIAFESAARLTEDDDDDAVDIYVYEVEGDRLTRVSAPPAGEQPYDCVFNSAGVVTVSCNADLGFRGGETGLLADRLGNDGYRHFNISDDGSVYFETRLALVPEDQNGRHYDVYRWRAGDLSLVSPGASDDHAFFSGNSRDGSSVFFWSSQRIDPREIDEHDYDIYVARVGGGFPLPPAPPPPCQVLADACQGGGGQAVPIAPTTPAGGGSNATPGARADLRVVRPGAKERRRAARRGVVRLRVRSNTTGRIVLRARARMRLRGKAVTRPAGSARTVLRQPGARTVALRLSKTARRQLIQGRRVRLRVVARHPGARPQTVGFVLQRGGRR